MTMTATASDANHNSPSTSVASTAVRPSKLLLRFFANSPLLQASKGSGQSDIRSESASPQLIIPEHPLLPHGSELDLHLTNTCAVDVDDERQERAIEAPGLFDDNETITDQTPLLVTSKSAAVSALRQMSVNPRRRDRILTRNKKDLFYTGSVHQLTSTDLAYFSGHPGASTSAAVVPLLPPPLTSNATNTVTAAQRSGGQSLLRFHSMFTPPGLVATRHSTASAATFFTPGLFLLPNQAGLGATGVTDSLAYGAVCNRRMISVDNPPDYFSISKGFMDTESVEVGLGHKEFNGILGDESKEMNSLLNDTFHAAVTSSCSADIGPLASSRLHSSKASCSHNPEATLTENIAFQNFGDSELNQFPPDLVNNLLLTSAAAVAAAAASSPTGVDGVFHDALKEFVSTSSAHLSGQTEAQATQDVSVSICISYCSISLISKYK
ncbi:unnamed protein product [Protopolystoma xenopodis]|uniref:Uncharacterized protein n=1 Tax=Protopolystoma xenopodis TaxID=117903 RepID=A0A448XF82_9PLAT|nr:unnamed protein product [Protopolystoma xenopodis]